MRMLMNMRYAVAVAVISAIACAANAHDTWVQTNTNIVRAGDVVYVDLMLGNHGNDHRDFKVAGKADIESITLAVVAPDGTRTDLKPSLIDQGYAPKEGYWTAKYQTDKPGLYTVAHTSDAVVTYAPKRSVKSGKTYVVASASLDKVPLQNPGFEKPLGHALEIVPKSNPVTPMSPGVAMSVQVMFKGKPMPGARVSFIPRGQKLKDMEFDERFERKADEKGVATFEPTDANYYLVVAHHEETGEKGEGYESTKYSATMTVLVPAVCSCCGG